MSAVGIQHCASGLAVCSVCVADRHEEVQPLYTIDFEFLEFSKKNSSSDINERAALYKLCLQESEILKKHSHDMQLVLQVQSDFPGRDSQPLWAQAPSDDKIIAYNALLSALRVLYPASCPNSRANKSKDTAMAEVMRQLNTNISRAAVASSPAHEFGTPEASKAYRQRGTLLRKAAEDFLRSDCCNCTVPGTTVFNSCLAGIRAVLADALWLAMYDVQQQLKKTRKRSRGADARGVYKANKRPAAPPGGDMKAAAAAAAAAAAIAKNISPAQELDPACSGASCPNTVELTPATPLQPPQQRQRRQAAVAAAARLIDLTADDANDFELPGCACVDLTQHADD